MTISSRSSPIKFTAFIVGMFFLIYGLIEAKVFLAPICVAVILTLLLIPLDNIFAKWIKKRTITSLLSTLVLFSVSVGFFVLVTAQINNVVDEWDTIKETMTPKVEQLATFLTEKTPITEEKVNGLKAKFKTSKLVGQEGNREKAFAVVSQLFSFFGTFLLVFIYVFFLLRFREKFKIFFISLFSENNTSEIKKTLQEITEVAQGYLVGKFKLIGLLAIIYSLGLGVSGVNNFILIAFLAAILTLIPYLGNVIGFCLALIFGYLTQGEIGVLIGIGLTFTITQFIESYILQPYVVGDEVDLNPFFIILSVILGNLIWGIIGMLVAIPVLAILNVIFLHISALKPVGKLLRKNQG
ncbi:AI-2E family transporter [Patiriisocius marinistellae]|uniref:AI-2E family transporter n=1 Tax=Patiriisocius marinistellae TaxID=2494560 RepID=A0A5J4G1D2_9FLAO|nr:AI-2E family transporter [Patiriisocius marinistellae]GEQ86429.1 AI-2E family transporter [Patiriisocius marinistellae]